MKDSLLSIIISILIITIGAISTFISIKLYNKEDAPLEEISELIVKETTGLDIDFTPNSKEVN